MFRYFFCAILLVISVYSYADTCNECHEFGDVTPKDHKKVSVFELKSCFACHERTNEGETDIFVSKLHKSHVPPSPECNACHTFGDDRPFTLKGIDKDGEETSDKDIIVEMMTSWRESGRLDMVHGSNGIFCTGCHGRKLPELGQDVDNAVCLKCHGPLEDLQKKTEPALFPDRNPHNSHLGIVNCTICHHMHSEQEVYCLKCHEKFDMKIPEK